MFANGMGLPSTNADQPTLLSLRNERASGLPAPSALTGSHASTASSTTRASTTMTTNANGMNEDLDSLSAVELRNAIVSIMQSKDRMAAALEEARQRGEEAREEIDRRKRENAALRDSVDKLKEKMVEVEANADSKSKFLQRENQLLKHQLKKYVGTVQTLQRQNTTAESVAADAASPGALAVDAAIEKLNMGNDGGSADGSGGRSASGSFVDDADMLRESYEQKLIQVSEMHSELMEFNDQLVMQVGFWECQMCLQKEG